MRFNPVAELSGKSAGSLDSVPPRSGWHRL